MKISEINTNELSEFDIEIIQTMGRWLSQTRNVSGTGLISSPEREGNKPFSAPSMNQMALSLNASNNKISSEYGHNEDTEFLVDIDMICSIFSFRPTNRRESIKYLLDDGTIIRNLGNKSPKKYAAKKKFFRERLSSEDYNRLLEGKQLREPVMMRTTDINKVLEQGGYDMKIRAKSGQPRARRARTFSIKGSGERKMWFLVMSDWKTSNTKLYNIMRDRF